MINSVISGNSSQKRRDRLYIMAEILNITKDGALKTQIMYKANLSFAQLNEYLKLLAEIKLLEIIKHEGKTVYKTTEKGFQYLQNYKEIVEILQSENAKSSPRCNPPILWLKRNTYVNNTSNHK